MRLSSPALAILAAPCPGPPLRKKTGSGAGLESSAGSTTMDKGILRPACAARSSNTSYAPHRTLVS